MKIFTMSIICICIAHLTTQEALLHLCIFTAASSQYSFPFCCSTIEFQLVSEIHSNIFFILGHIYWYLGPFRRNGKGISGHKVGQLLLVFLNLQPRTSSLPSLHPSFQLDHHQFRLLRNLLQGCWTNGWKIPAWRRGWFIFVHRCFAIELQMKKMLKSILCSKTPHY